LKKVPQRITPSFIGSRSDNKAFDPSRSAKHSQNSFEVGLHKVSDFDLGLGWLRQHFRSPKMSRLNFAVGRSVSDQPGNGCLSCSGAR
jgi:hypothetical protein